jgi:hypothetical protein
MGNTLTNVTATMVQDEVLPALKLGLVPVVNALSFQAVTDRPLYFGDVVRVPIAGAAGAAGTFADDFETGDTTTTSTQVTIGAPAFRAWHVKPKTEGFPTVERFLAHGREAAYSLAKKVLQDVLKLYVRANVGDTNNEDYKVIAAGSWDSTDYADMLNLLRAKGIDGRVSAFLSLPYVPGVQKSPQLTDASAYGNAGLIQTGEIPPVLGVRSFYTDAFPTEITTTNEYTGVIFTSPDTAAIAMGTSGDPVETDILREFNIVDPDTGISMTWRQWINTKTDIHWGAVYCQYGVAFSRDAAVRVRTQ